LNLVLFLESIASANSNLVLDEWREQAIALKTARSGSMSVMAILRQRRIDLSVSELPTILKLMAMSPFSFPICPVS
jgi:hypothetical protein